MPIEVLTIINKPRTIGLMPRAVAIGSSIGVTSKIIDCVSRKQPRKRSKIFIIKRITYLLVKRAIVVVEIIAGIFSVVINQLKGADMLTIKSTMDEEIQDSEKTRYRVRISIS